MIFLLRDARKIQKRRNKNDRGKRIFKIEFAGSFYWGLFIYDVNIVIRNFGYEFLVFLSFIAMIPHIS